MTHGTGLLAEIRVGKHTRDTPFHRARIDGQGWAWYRVTLGKSKRIRCECGGSLQINDPKWVCCSHIQMLQECNGITEDIRKADRWGNTGPRLIRLTERGKHFFYPNWLTKELT